MARAAVATSRIRSLPRWLGDVQPDVDWVCAGLFEVRAPEFCDLSLLSDGEWMAIFCRSSTDTGDVYFRVFE